MQSSKNTDHNHSESTALNTNASSTGTSMHINGNTKMGMYVYGATGAHGTHVCTIQISMDDSTWQDTSYTVTGEGYIEGTTVANYMRAKVTTTQGATSTCDVHIASK